MEQSLIFLRCIGSFLGLFIVLLSFNRFQNNRSKRSEFFLMILFGLSLTIISIFPNSANILTRMFALDKDQFGRLISLLIFSNLAAWLLLFGIRNKLADSKIQFDLLVRKMAIDKLINSPSCFELGYITIIIPALNEVENLKILLPKIPHDICGVPVGTLVVDDGSSDETVSAVKALGHYVISNPINRGGGAALRLGYDVAKHCGSRIVVTMDGDGQHLPEEVERLVKPIIDDQCDIVIGSRVLGEREKDSWVRLVGIHFFNAVINLLAGIRITDCSNGFRAFRVSSLEKIILQQDQFHTAELIIDAARKSIRISEAPITVLKRHSGISKKGKNLSYGYNFAKTIVKTFLRNQ